MVDKRNTINDKIEQVKVNIAEVLAECKLEMEKALGSAELPGDVNDMQTELKKEEKRLIAALGEVITQISATTAEEFETEMKDKTSTDLKKALGEQFTDVNPLMTECSKAIGSFRRAYKKISGCANKKSKNNVAADPILGAQEMVQHGIRRGRTVPTLKAGVRVVVDKPLIHNLTSECKPSFYNMPKDIITKCETAGFKAHAKWLKKHCKDNSLTTANSQFRPMVSKQITNIVEKAFPDFKFFQPTMTDDQKGLETVAYGYKMFLVQDLHYSIMPVQYGAVECRLLFEGQYWVMGLPLQQVPGHSLGEKIKWTEAKDIYSLTNSLTHLLTKATSNNR